jgi:hypothetical protein
VESKEWKRKQMVLEEVMSWWREQGIRLRLKMHKRSQKKFVQQEECEIMQQWEEPPQQIMQQGIRQEGMRIHEQEGMRIHEQEGMRILEQEGMRIHEQEELQIIEQEEPSQQEGMRIHEQAWVWKQEKLRKGALFSEERVFSTKARREIVQEEMRVQ